MMELHGSCVLASTLAEHNTSIQAGSGHSGVPYLELSSHHRRHTTLAGDDDTSQLEDHFDKKFHFYHKTEAQIEQELKRVISLLATCEEYQKYREKQVLSKKKGKVQKWPYRREVAFFRALVRYVPMGRSKLMLEGQAQGRNQLIAQSIKHETGEECERKHISSHVQVIKKKLADCPELLAYLPQTEDKKRNTKKARYRSHQIRSRRHSFKYDEGQAHSGSQPYHGHMASPIAGQSRSQHSYDGAPYSVGGFGMFVWVGDGHQKRVVHHFTELGRNSRLNAVHVRDTTSWHKQFPEFNFHRTDELRNRPLLICDARIKVMTRPLPPGAELTITFDLCIPPDLSEYIDDLECSTRFFEDGRPVGQGEKGGQGKQAGKVVDKHMEPDGRLRIQFGAGFFGAGFWACQMQKMGNILCKASEEEQSTRAEYESIVRRELQQLTAAQNIYRVKDGESKCLLTILWRFSQTRSSHEPGRVMWRAVHFERPKDGMAMQEMELDKILGPPLMLHRLPETSDSTSPIPASTCFMYPSLPLEFDHAFPQHASHLDLDTMTLDNMTSDFSHTASTASSLGNSFSQLHTLSSLSDSRNLAHTQSQVLEEADDFDLNSGHMAISGCLEPTTHLGAYAPYDSETHLNTPSYHDALLSTVAEFEHHTETSFDDLGLDMSMNTAATTAAAASMSAHYVAAPKPSWPHSSLVEHLGGAAEQYSNLMAQATEGGGEMDLEGVLDDGACHDGSGLGVSSGGGDGLWKLQRAFGDEDDAGIGAVVGEGQDASCSRKDSLVGKGAGGGSGGGDSGVLRIMELLQSSTEEDEVDKF